MITTLAKFANAKRQNYCTLPTINVTILPDVHHCADCKVRVEYVNPNPGRYLGTWEHQAPTDCTWGNPMTRCRYCHTEDPAQVKHYQMAYSDETHCSRCGGVDGYPIGD